MSIRQFFIGSVGILLALSMSACGAGTDGERGGERGFELKLSTSDEAAPSDAGLPAYPGAKPYKDEDDESSAANIGFSSSVFGLKVVAMNLETRDGPEKVAQFYHRALNQYGPVLDCSDRMSSAPAGEDGLSCDDNEPGEHAVVYKVGSKDHQRVVAIKSHGSGTRFSLVQVDVRSDSQQ